MHKIINPNIPIILQQMKADWPNQLHILSDFDRTLTQAKNVGSLISILYTQGYLSQKYQQEAQALHDHYLPIEKDEHLPLNEKQQAMLERWTKHKQLLIEEGLTKEHMYQAMKSEQVQLREGYQTFFSLLQQYHIPLVILSAWGLGTLSIQQYLKHHNVQYENIFLVGNEFIRDETGKAIGFTQPLIHSLNKSAMIVQKFPKVYAQVQERTNVILLGDSPNDVQMIDGFLYKNLLKIWFLNTDDKMTRKTFEKLYDVLIFDDGSLEYVNQVIKEILM